MLVGLSVAPGASVVHLDGGEVLAVAGVANGDLVVRSLRGPSRGGEEGNAACDEHGCDSASGHRFSLQEDLERVNKIFNRAPATKLGTILAEVVQLSVARLLAEPQSITMLVVGLLLLNEEGKFFFVVVEGDRAVLDVLLLLCSLRYGGSVLGFLRLTSCPDGLRGPVAAIALTFPVLRCHGVIVVARSVRVKPLCWKPPARTTKPPP